MKLGRQDKESSEAILEGLAKWLEEAALSPGSATLSLVPEEDGLVHVMIVTEKMTADILVKARDLPRPKPENHGGHCATD